jgi:hypothetical protein
MAFVAAGVARRRNDGIRWRPARSGDEIFYSKAFMAWRKTEFRSFDCYRSLKMEQAIVREKVALSVFDGTSMDAYVARPRSPGPHPGIIVLQEAYGVNSHIRDVT